MEAIRAIQTKYDGILFRSRIEARWALFFNELGIPYDYEREGYELQSGRYLPDFWLPMQQAWIEIKGREPNNLEIELARELASTTGFRVFISHGAIPRGDDHHQNESMIYIPSDAAGFDTMYHFCECPKCHQIGIQFQGRVERMSCNCMSHESKMYCQSKRIRAAYDAARTERFGT